MAYLDDHPPRHQQFRCPRRQRPSGIIGVHTAESFPDESGPDTGAENVARFIRDRTNYGSYHLLADSDSIIQLVRFECVAYHIGTHGLNEHTIGISAATQAAKWHTLGAGYRDAMVRNAARAAARAVRWLQDNYGIVVPSRRITLAQALRGERGFLAHGDADPTRRTDPGATFPWGDFLAYYAATMNGEDDMPTPQEIAEAVWGHKDYGNKVPTSDGESEWTPTAGQRLHRIERRTARRLDAADVAAAVVALLPDGSLDQATAEAAFRTVLGSLDDA